MRYSFSNSESRRYQDYASSPQMSIKKKVHIKSEPLDDDEYGTKSYQYGSIGSSPNFTGGGYLSKRSAAVQNAKAHGDYPASLLGTCFETTGMIINPDNNVALEVTHAMFDTGASSNLISMRAVRAARLPITHCTPKKFTLADGSKVYHDKYVTFEIFFAGINHVVTAFIEESRSDHNMLVGMPCIKQFRARPNFSLGPRKETRWYVSHDITGLRRQQFVLKEDSAVLLPSISIYTYNEGLRMAGEPGETCKERNSREILERHEARGARLRARHGRRGRRSGYRSDDEYDD